MPAAFPAKPKTRSPLPRRTRAAALLCRQRPPAETRHRLAAVVIGTPADVGTGQARHRLAAVTVGATFVLKARHTRHRLAAIVVMTTGYRRRMAASAGALVVPAGVAGKRRLGHDGHDHRGEAEFPRTLGKTTLLHATRQVTPLHREHRCSSLVIDGPSHITLDLRGSGPGGCLLGQPHYPRSWRNRIHLSFRQVCCRPHSEPVSRGRSVKRPLIVTTGNSWGIGSVATPALRNYGLTSS
jgi:hypothetical protein